MLKKILATKTNKIPDTQLYLTTINNLSDAIFTLDKRGNLRFYNAAALSLLDTNRDISGEKISNLLNLSDETGKKISPMKLICEATRRVETEKISHKYKNGQKIRLFLAISQLKNSRGKMSGAVILARDITKQKSLDDERDEFISVVSHELRTPVAIAEGALSNLELMLQKNIAQEKFSKTLSAAHEQILYLGQMVNDLSTLSRAQRGVYMDAELINVTDFLQNSFAKYQPSAAEKNLALRLDLDQKISAEMNISTAKMAIEEIMQNLITNAIKYTKSGEVVIGAKVIFPEQKKSQKSGAAEKEKIEFFVQDSGIGISASDQKHIFEKFWRSEDFRTRETNGTGLGLHVALSLAEKINTKIVVCSKLNHGSRFSFRLRLEKNSESSEKTNKSQYKNQPF